MGRLSEPPLRLERRCTIPCYTLVQVEVKDRAMAEKALGRMGVEANITPNANGTHTVTPKSAEYGFRDNFLQRYSVEVAKRKAKREGYTVVEKEENGEQVLYLRQY